MRARNHPGEKVRLAGGTEKNKKKIVYSEAILDEMKQVLKRDETYVNEREQRKWITN